MARPSAPLPRIAGLLAAAAFLLAACARPTPYAPRSNGEGYAEQAIEDRRYRVTFAGNSATPRTRVENGLLLRAAELAQERGHAHFVVVDRTVGRKVGFLGTLYGPTGFHGHGLRHAFHGPHAFRGFHGGHGLHGLHGFGTLAGRPITRYTASAEVVLRDGPKPPDNANAYDADAVVTRLRPTLAEANGE